MTHLLLPRNHALEERLERGLEVLDTLALETRRLVLHEARNVVELVLRVERAPLRVRDDCERAPEHLRPELALRAVALVRLLRALQMCVCGLPHAVHADARAERELCVTAELDKYSKVEVEATREKTYPDGVDEACVLVRCGCSVSVCCTWGMGRWGRTCA